MAFDHHGLLQTLTERPGVYCMLDKHGKAIYVGKAKNLKKRVGSYFSRGREGSAKTRVMVKQVESIEVTVTHTENEALILESNLIKEYRPRYNILFRDGKSYPYIFISSEHDYPRFRYHRGSLKARGRYFGPYPGAGAVKRTLNLIQKLFLIRSCEDSVFANRSRPCLQYQIKRCSAPCVGLVSKDDYARDVEHAMLFLEGKNEQVIGALTEPMQRASDALEFEQAARLRDQIRALRRVQEKQHISADVGDIDIISCVMLNHQACINLVIIRAGLHLGSRNIFPQRTTDSGEADLLRAFIAQHYLNRAHTDIPGEIVLSAAIADAAVIADVLGGRQGRKVVIKDQVRGERVKWLEMAAENARISLDQKLAGNRNQLERLESLQQLLGFAGPIERMECFDISHTRGEATIGSCVVFDREGPRNRDYRQFNIKDVKAGDDYAAMQQVIRRRYTRLLGEEATLPDLVLIDGGKGQVNRAKEALAELQLTQIPLLGVAKGPSRKAGLETLVLALEDRTIRCDSDSPALHLIRHIRDEAHRFAISAHRQQRGKVRKRSKLEDIEGIGNKRRHNLIRHFGGVRGIARAGVEDIAMVPGISKGLAEKIYDTFHTN